MQGNKGWERADKTGAAGVSVIRECHELHAVPGSTEMHTPRPIKVKILAANAGRSWYRQRNLGGGSNGQTGQGNGHRRGTLGYWGGDCRGEWHEMGRIGGARAGDGEDGRGMGRAAQGWHTKRKEGWEGQAAVAVKLRRPASYQGHFQEHTEAAAAVAVSAA